MFSTVDRALNTYAESWAAMYQEACEATQVRGEQSAEVLDLRMSCLQERLGGMRALTDLFAEASGGVVENAVSAVNALGSLDRCADVPLLRSVVRPPEDPSTRARVAELRRRLAGLKARYDAGRWKEVVQQMPGLVAEARVIGYLPLVAEALAQLGIALLKSNDSKAAEHAFVESFWAADGSRHDEVRAEAASYLVFVFGFQEGHFEEAERWSKTAEAVLQRIGGHELLHAWLLNNMGSVLYMRGERQAALRLQTEALALKEKALGREHPDVGVSEGNLAIALAELALNQEALTHVDRSITLLENGLGAGHPDTGHAAEQPRRDPGRAGAAPRGTAVVRAGARHLGTRAGPGRPQPGVRADRHRQQLPGGGRSRQRAGAAGAGVQIARGARRQIGRGAPRPGLPWRGRCGNRTATAGGRGRWPNRRRRGTRRGRAAAA